MWFKEVTSRLSYISLRQLYDIRNLVPVAAVRSKSVIMLLLVHHLWSWLCGAVVCNCRLDGRVERLGWFTLIIEPVHEISNNMVCATNKASDQPAHSRSLTRAFASRLSIL